MKEAEVCTRIVNTINDAGHWAFKIPDMPYMRGLSFNREKAFDITAAIHGYPVAIEVKLREALPKKFSTLEKLLTPSQVKHLRDFRENGRGHSFVMLCVFKPNRKASLRRHELYIIPWTTLTEAHWEPETMTPFSYKKGRYDLGAFLKGVEVFQGPL